MALTPQKLTRPASQGKRGKEGLIYRDYYQSVFGYRQYHVLGIKIVLCEPVASIIHYFLFPIHDTADTQRHEGNNLFII